MRPIFALLAGSIIFAAAPASSHYMLKDYGVNSGGSNSTSSSTYSAQGTSGEITGGSTTGPTYTTKTGSTQAGQADVPPAPTLSNGSGAYFNKLNFTINVGSNPTDATYAVAVSTTSDFASTSYVQTDGTLGASQVYRAYSAWGSGSGSLATGLNTGTTYYFKVSAMQGKFTASAFGPSANIATSTPALSFSLTPSTINLGTLTAGSIITNTSISFTFTTNAPNGGTIYMAGSATGLLSASNSNYTIQVSPPSGDLSSLNEGFGYQALSASAPLTIQSPYNGTSNTVGSIYTSFQPVYTAATAVNSGTATGAVMAKAKVSTPAGTDYSDVLTFVAAASY